MLEHLINVSCSLRLFVCLAEFVLVCGGPQSFRRVVRQSTRQLGSV
jgi:hypothetical protein